MHLKTAYELGILRALREAGLTKHAVNLGTMGTIGRWATSNPLAARTAAGAAIGGVVGGSTDIGAGRGAMAGGLAGLGSGLGAKWGQGALRKSYRTDLAQAAKGRKLPAALTPAQPTGQLEMFGPRNAAEFYGPVRGNEAVNQVIKNYTGGHGAAGLQQAATRAGNWAGLGAGALAGGGALMATQPSEPKHWWG